MPDYLFDSNALIYAANPAPEYNLFRQMVAIPGPRDSVSAMSKLEVLGFHNLTPADKEFFEAVFSSLPIHPICNQVIETATELACQYRLRAADAIIAATALSNNLVLVTADTHFDRVMSLTTFSPLALPNPITSI